MKFTLILLTIFSFNTFAGQTARVLMVRGDVTQLSPGAKEARKVKKGDTYNEDTSVLTGEKSVVRLKFADKSVMNLGPKSKVVVSKMPKKKPNMISLLTGSIKAEVEKKNTGRTKMIVKTKSAVMGIRGTKFQAIYNAQNKNTSLVTVEGKVAMVKKEAVQEKLVKEEVVQKEAAPDEMLDVDQAPQEEVVQKVVSSDEELDALDEAFDEASENASEVVEVDAGKFAGVQEAAAKPTVPVKIAPVQYEALAKSMGSDKKAEDVMETTDAKEEVKELEQLADKGEVVQKPGGYVDFETGLYVPPSEDAKLNEDTGTFEVEKEVGKIDQKTGDYIPPKGVKLDAKKGFVVDQKELAQVASKEEAAVTLALVKERNKEVKKQVVVNKMEAKSKSATSSFTKNSKVTFEFVPFSEVLTLKAGNGDSEFLTDQAYDVLLGYSKDWNKIWSTNFKLGFVTYELDESDDGNFRDSQNNDDMILNIDTFQKLNERWSLNYELTRRAYYFAYPGDNGDVIVDPFELTYIGIGGVYSWRTWKDIALTAGGKLMLFLEEDVQLKGDRGKETIDGGGIHLYLNGEYQFSNKIVIQARGFMQNITHELRGGGEFERFTLGSSLMLNYAL